MHPWQRGKNINIIMLACFFWFPLIYFYFFFDLRARSHGTANRFRRSNTAKDRFQSTDIVDLGYIHAGEQFGYIDVVDECLRPVAVDADEDCDLFFVILKKM